MITSYLWQDICKLLNATFSGTSKKKKFTSHSITPSINYQHYFIKWTISKSDPEHSQIILV